MAKIGFCGISGSGMSSLAQILKLSGHEVRGSDRNFDLGRDLKNKAALEALGIKMFPQDGSSVDNTLDFLCASTAVEDTIPDIKAAKEKGVAIKTRPELLAEIFHSYKYGVAVGGTSGKTTTTAMIGFILDKAGKKPCMINGGLLRDYEGSAGIPNIIFNKGDICVVEADESNGSINLYNPYISVINNISADHKSLEELSMLFQQLADRTKHTVIINDDYDLCRQIAYSGNLRTFSLHNTNADFYADNIKPLAGGTQYRFVGKIFHLNLIGAFNVANALAAIAACAALGVEPEIAAAILENFHGTKRRLEVIGVKNNITVIDDFAHNPDKVKASVSALKQYTGRLIIMFQPHGFGPMRSLGKEIMAEFVNNMGADDILVMPEIFFVGGTVTKDISSADLINHAKSLGKQNAFFFAERQQVEDFILKTAKSGDRIVIMGARDNSLTELCHDILQRLET
ncbi:MAG: UDP-N-acetylmuramate--alanine ligase [Alphaproteobacteria bacterium]|nr:UDP-N-acetylmuramate--alanine ligase [Alphaproteobacteria bacterium]